MQGSKTRVNSEGVAKFIDLSLNKWPDCSVEIGKLENGYRFVSLYRP